MAAVLMDVKGLAAHQDDRQGSAPEVALESNLKIDLQLNELLRREVI